MEIGTASKRCAVFFVVLGMASLRCTAQGGTPEAGPLATVFVIGTVHAPRGLLLDSSYSAAHIRAALDRFQPDLIGVEADPLSYAWGITSYAAWEIEQVVVPWASARDVPVFGIDWQDVGALATGGRNFLRFVRDAEAMEPQPLQERVREAQQVAARVDELLGGDFADPEGQFQHEWFNWINSGRRNDARPVIDWWAGAGREDRQGQMVRQLAARDDRIVHQIQALLDRYAGRRMAVLIGFSHKPDLDRKLASLPGVRVIQLGDLGGLDRADLHEHWAPEDAIAVLRESLDGNAYYYNPAAVRRDLVRKNMDALNAARVENAEFRYFEARIAAIEGRREEAKFLLREILETAEDSSGIRFGPWPPVVNVRQLARVELGKVLDLEGDRAGALREYRRVLEELDGMRPAIPSDTAYATLTEWATEARVTAARISAYQTFRGLVEMLLREPWQVVGSPAEVAPSVPG